MVNTLSKFQFKTNSFFLAFTFGFITMELYLLIVQSRVRKNSRGGSNKIKEGSTKVGMQDEPENSSGIHTGG